jgi:NAD(P)-dependent dehydrogenase (short-subunit alcohol dehydrogenase family)
MRVLITGATNGMGLGVAEALAGSGDPRHEVIFLGRDAERGAGLVHEVAGKTGNDSLSFIQCDLTMLSDVKRAVGEIQTGYKSLDAIFVNAGLGYAPERRETPDGMDPHFQVNYLSHFLLVISLLDQLEKSESGGRVIFNATPGGEIFWDDLQMKKKWHYEDGIHQAMVAKRMFLNKLNRLHRSKHGSKLSFVGYSISKTVWSNQINIIPGFMRFMATLMKLFGGFISVEECGRIMAPLFEESQDSSLEKSGKLITSRKGVFSELTEDESVLNPDLQDRLWDISLELCGDSFARRVSEQLHNKM